MTVPRRPVLAEPRPQAAGERGRNAFLIGNVGRLGGELLDALLESPRYVRVAVAVRKPMRSHIWKLEPVAVPPTREGWDPAKALTVPVDDLFLCIEPERASFWKVATPYVALTSREAVAIARAMRAAGARRVALLTPMEALHQMGMMAAIRDVDELAIHQCGFERMLVLRPSEEAPAGAPAGFFGAIGALVTRTLASYMTPRRQQPVRARQAAQAAVEALATMEDGLQVIDAARLRELVGDPMGS